MKRQQNKHKGTALAGMLLLLGIILSGCDETEQIQFRSETMEMEMEMETETETESAATIALDEKVQKAAEEAIESELCYVHICGAVKNPGVYEVEKGSRAYEVIEKAGGFTPEASVDDRNQAAIVTDGEQIKILTVEEAKEVQKEDAVTGGTKKSQPAAQSDLSLININTATEAELCTLPGVGSGKATSIIAYREERGAFQSIEEIQQVEGIKNGVYQKLKDKITVS